jgi:hypothetical protein
VEENQEIDVYGSEIKIVLPEGLRNVISLDTKTKAYLEVTANVRGVSKYAVQIHDVNVLGCIQGQGASYADQNPRLFLFWIQAGVDVCLGTDSDGSGTRLG